MVHFIWMHRIYEIYTHICYAPAEWIKPIDFQAADSDIKVLINLFLRHLRLHVEATIKQINKLPRDSSKWFIS